RPTSSSSRTSSAPTVSSPMRARVPSCRRTWTGSSTWYGACCHAERPGGRTGLESADPLESAMNAIKRSFVLAALALASACSFQARATLQPGDPAPDFSAPAWLAGEAFDYSLAKALRDGPVVLYFFPAANTPGCNIEA